MSRDKLRALEELQKVDLQIRDLAQQAEKHPARLKQIETERNQARVALDAQRGRLADNERARRQNEQLLQLEKEKVRKWESRLSELKTPREYAALARELDIAKKTNQGADEEIKRLSGEYEELKRGIAELEKALGKKAEYNMLPMQPGDVLETYADIDDLIRDVGFKPSTTIEEGLPKFVAWYKDFHKV